MPALVPRAPIVGRYTAQELALAARNHAMPLEALAWDVTPPGLHYTLVHFDIPRADPCAWRLAVDGLVAQPLSLSLEALQRLPSRTVRATMECAGNGRGHIVPRYPSMPWLKEGVSTADWHGVPLALLLDRAGLRPSATELVFWGADRGVDRGVEHAFARSLARAHAECEDVIVAWAMNGAPLAPQHGAPLRLVVPGWYGMASVKWLERIEAVDRPFDGVQQAHSYRFRRAPQESGVPCTRIRVNSLMVPPGIPDFYTRRRIVSAGRVEIFGRAWSGSAPIVRVEFGVDGVWSEAALEAAPGRYAWCGWRATWEATPGEHELSCRATDASGARQPLEPPWDEGGFGNHAVQRVAVSVR
ncbi:MAG: sulfite oxidase [Burkholderiales bacterium]|nr:sulfite oxidase [Burkholderiales bacterium]